MPFSLFGAEKIPIDSIHHVEKTIPNIILWAVPVMVFFTVIEMVVAYYQEHDFGSPKFVMIDCSLSPQTELI